MNREKSARGSNLLSHQNLRSQTTVLTSKLGKTKRKNIEDTITGWMSTLISLEWGIIRYPRKKEKKQRERVKTCLIFILRSDSVWQVSLLCAKIIITCNYHHTYHSNKIRIMVSSRPEAPTPHFPTNCISAVRGREGVTSNVAYVSLRVWFQLQSNQSRSCQFIFYFLQIPLSAHYDPLNVIKIATIKFHSS